METEFTVEEVSREEWLRRYRETEELLEAVFAELIRVYPDEDEMIDQLLDFRAGYKNERLTRVNLERYAAWHLLAGSTPTFEMSPLFDLPGELITHYVKAKLEELKQMPTATD